MDKNLVRTNLYLAYMLFCNGYKQDRVTIYRLLFISIIKQHRGGGGGDRKNTTPHIFYL